MRVTVIGATGNVGSGMRENAGGPTPPLDLATSAPARVREVLTGIGHASR
ncbi:MAG: hypothetical protein JWM73_815 [Solirubrobacterales bacterium]|nr:hypothetical protein [Solirubrobacterales bacterium]